MFRHRGGESVKGGYYWCRGSWRVEAVEGAAGMLPGDATREYVRVPVLLMIPFALVLSVAFVLFLPLIGFGVLAEWLFSQARATWRRQEGSRAAAPVGDTPTSRRG